MSKGLGNQAIARFSISLNSPFGTRKILPFDCERRRGGFVGHRIVPDPMAPMVSRGFARWI